MKSRIICLIICSTFVVGGIAAAYRTGSEEAVIKNIVQAGDALRQYEMLEISAVISGQHANPYDSEYINLAAVITGPDGRKSTIPAFYTGRNSTWKVRFTPLKPGRYSWRFLLKLGARERTSPVRRFEVLSGGSDGFVRKGRNNPLYPVFDSGNPFFGFGHNIAWIKNNDISEYEKYFAIFKETGCNLTRIWINNPWAISMEYKKIGEYDSAGCELIDSIVSLARRYGIYLILVLDSYGSLMVEKGPWNEQSWQANPYNRKNGGPCEKPADFFTDETAKKYYRNRLRYIVGRWGYSPNILAFELWNEYDAPADWTKEMAEYLKSISPNKQFVTTSTGYPWDNNFDETAIWSIPAVDIVERHVYGNRTRDLIENLITVNGELSRKYGKMLLVGEFGMDAEKNDAAIDIFGNAAAFHCSLWAAAMTGSFASSMNWWWDEYVRAKNLYPHYRALANFLRGVQWDSTNTGFLKTSTVTVRQGSRASHADVTIHTAQSWGEMTYSEFTIGNNGDCLGGIVNAYLHGMAKAGIRIEPVFHVNYPAGGKFILHAGTVSQGANLIVYVDGKEALIMQLPAGPGKGPWKKSSYLEAYKIYQCAYDTLIEVPVPEGAHTIKLSNTGKDWLYISGITLTGYGSANFASVRPVGLRAGKEMLLWIQNKEYDWRNDIRCITPSVVKGAGFSIEDVASGAYAVEWWDTFEGKIMANEMAEAKDGRLSLSLPGFSKDVACKIRRVP